MADPKSFASSQPISDLELPLHEATDAREILTRIAKAVSRDGIADPRSEANLICQMALGIEHRILMHHQITITPAIAEHISHLVAKRNAGMPISRMRGNREFFSLSFQLNDHTLDPRADSEILVEQALSFANQRDWQADQPCRVVDFGTGTGCLLLSFLANLDASIGLGLDISDQAVAMARQNATQLGLSQKTQFCVSDWDSALSCDAAAIEPSYKGPFDVIFSNPPYIKVTDLDALSIEVAQHDPHRALFAGADGLDAYRQLLPLIPALLAEGGALFLEIGRGQEDDVIGLGKAAGLRCDGQYKDLGQIIRCLKFMI
ncbi:MAG: peptide chain release factor N(5)-glutamine methyltransferase [Candidatus Puniceispirillaceae bacterium]